MGLRGEFNSESAIFTDDRTLVDALVDEFALDLEHTDSVSYEQIQRMLVKQSKLLRVRILMGVDKILWRNSRARAPEILVKNTPRPASKHFSPDFLVSGPVVRGPVSAPLPAGPLQNSGAPGP
ncbi:MAG: hypothetical protein IT285_13200 [Bdellovibrionales bacterium]|nr:hypothetical protein [Bdellovibrionales bacterium]